MGSALSADESILRLALHYSCPFCHMMAVVKLWVQLAHDFVKMSATRSRNLANVACDQLEWFERDKAGYILAKTVPVDGQSSRDRPMISFLQFLGQPRDDSNH